LIIMFTLAGCGDPPELAGDALRDHLLGLATAQRDAGDRGDVSKARSYMLPELLNEMRTLHELMDVSWDVRLTDEQLQRLRSRPRPFSGDAPVEMETSGDWARLVQPIDDQRVWYGYFAQRNGRWWIAEIGKKSGYEPDAPFAVLRAETYWPEHIGDYFLLPTIELKVSPAANPAADLNEHNWQLSLHVTNVSEQTISAETMRRRFTSVQYVRGDLQSAAEPEGGEGLAALPPGDTRYIGDVTIRKPAAAQQRVVFYVGRYTAAAPQPGP
jgi:hypothetical protein